MTLAKPSQPQPGAAKPGGKSLETLPAWPPDAGRIEQAVLECLRGGQWAAYQGPTSERLVALLAGETGAARVRLVSSGTVAVELALRGCRVGPGDEVVLAAFDYPGNFRCVEATGANPVLIDVVPGRWTVSTDGIAAAITDRTRAVLVSHLYGAMADAPAIRQLAEERGVFFIEDACQASGALIDGRACGTWGHVGTLSFGGSKLLSCGNGGAILTDDSRIDSRIKIFTERPSDAFALSQLQAAALIPQIDSLAEWTRHRRRAAARLREAVATCSAEWQAGQAEPQDAENAYYKLAWFAPDRSRRDRAVAAARELGVPIGHGFSTFSRRAARRCRIIGDLQYAQRAAETTLVLDHRALAGDDRQLDALAERLCRALSAR